ncbi:MAG: DUF3327 domain-containing protein [Coriobacteriales bacterium]|nr:DUF3327 domain-containing protein [Coriobacteriales bacterium]
MIMRPTPPKVPRPTPIPLVSSPVIRSLKRKLRRLRTDMRAGEIAEQEYARLLDEEVERFWGTTAKQTPIITPASKSKDHAIVTFLWRDAEASSVLIFINRITDEKNLKDSLLRHISGTDVWYIAYHMESDWRASYCFLPCYGKDKVVDITGFQQSSIRQALDKGLVDPRNPEQCINRIRNTLSVVELKDAPPQPWLKARPEIAGRGVVSSHTVEGHLVWLYEPPFIDGACRENVSAIIVFDGDMWARGEMFPETLNNLISDGRIPPMYALLIESSDVATRWEELHEDAGIEYFIKNCLLSWARKHYPITSDPTRLIIAGQSLGGLTALWTALRLPDQIQNVIAQSSSLWRGSLMDTLEKPSNPYLRGFDGRIYMEVGRQEWVLRPYHQKLSKILERNNLDIKYVEYNGGHDYVCWRGGIADGLCWIADAWKERERA